MKRTHYLGTTLLVLGRLSLATIVVGLAACDRGEDEAVNPQEEPTEAVTIPVDPASPASVVTQSASTPASSSGLPSQKADSPLGDAQQQQVIQAVAKVLGNTPESVALDQPIINPGRGVEEFELLDILLELEDRFDVEISEEVIERATGDRFDDVQKQLTPRQLFDFVAEAVKEKK